MIRERFDTAAGGPSATGPDTELAVRWLRAVAADTRPGPLPGAGQLWWRAAILRRLAERDASAERAARPARWGLALAPVLFAAAAAAVFARQVSDALGPLSGGVGPVWLTIGLPFLLVPAVLLASWIAARRVP